MRDAEVGRRVVDKLARVARRGGTEEWIYIHLEIQGDEQGNFPERMFVYHSRLFDRYHKPIASLALLADDREHWRPTEYEHAALGCQIRMRFPVAKLLDWVGSEARLHDSSNPFALLTLAHLETRATRDDTAARYVAKYGLIKRLFRLGLDRKQAAPMFHMIDWMMRLPDADEQQFWDACCELDKESSMDYMTSFERRSFDRGYDKGLASGVEQGQRVGKLKIVTRLLEARFGELPAWVSEKLAAASDDELTAWTGSLLSADSVEAVFGISAH